MTPINFAKVPAFNFLDQALSVFPGTTEHKIRELGKELQDPEVAKYRVEIVDDLGKIALDRATSDNCMSAISCGLLKALEQSDNEHNSDLSVAIIDALSPPICPNLFGNDAEVRSALNEILRTTHTDVALRARSAQGLAGSLNEDVLRALYATLSEDNIVGTAAAESLRRTLRISDAPETIGVGAAVIADLLNPHTPEFARLRLVTILAGARSESLAAAPLTIIQPNHPASPTLKALTMERYLGSWKLSIDESRQMEAGKGDTQSSRFRLLRFSGALQELANSLEAERRNTDPVMSPDKRVLLEATRSMRQDVGEILGLDVQA